MKILPAVIAIAASLCPAVRGDEPMKVDFDNLELGVFAPEALSKTFGPLHWHNLGGRVVVAATSDPGVEQVLETRYPAGAYGSKHSGASFAAKLPPVQEYYLTYKLRFSDGFPFTKGGKLPGLSSSGSEFTGGRLPPKSGGWSARYMWRREGDLEIYLYHPKMKGPTGDRISLDFRCAPSIWYTLTQRIRVNDQGKTNGLIQVWINGTRYLDLDGLHLRGENLGLIDSFLFSTFFGGGGKSWAPESSCSIQFDQFLISESPPDFEQGQQTGGHQPPSRPGPK